jgi:hypothetical protein
MGFNKRYLNKEIVLSNLSKIDKLIKADALIMDSWTSFFIEDLSQKQRELRKELIEDTLIYSDASQYQNHKNFYLLNSLSEAIINLSTNPSWVDIHIVNIRCKFEILESERGSFQILTKKSLESAISYYDEMVVIGRDKKINQVL